MEFVDFVYLIVIVVLVVAFSGIFWALNQLSLNMIKGFEMMNERFSSLEKTVLKGIHDRDLRHKDFLHRLDKHSSLPADQAHSVKQTSET